MKIVFVEQDRCFGCRHCERVCAYQRSGDFQPRDANIRVAVDSEKMTLSNMTCFQCETAYCMEVCPTEAISRDPATGAKVVDSERCIGCRMCVMACPFGNMHFDTHRHVSHKCDLCGGEPRCVEFCMARALHYADINDLAEIKRRHADRKLKIYAIAEQGDPGK